MDRLRQRLADVREFKVEQAFDFAGIAAGAGKMPLWRFMVATFLGKFVKYYVVILVASGSLAGARDMFGW